jgi:hypothetical protein
MDPLTLATAFASVISLIADFKAQRSDQDSAEYADFAAWLSEHHHEEVLKLLNQNVSTSVSIKALLSQDRRVLRERLEALDKTLAALASSVEGFSGLASAIRPQSVLSPQAISILQQFEAVRASKVLESGAIGRGPLFLFIDGKHGQLQYKDERFVVDDFMTLVDLGLLRLDHNSSGKRMFVYTRTASEFLARTQRPYNSSSSGREEA